MTIIIIIDLTLSVLFPVGYFERLRPQPDAEAVRRAGVCTRNHQAVLPLQRQGPQKDLPGQVRGAEVSELCPFPIHADNRHTHQDLCQYSELPR